uniref:Uncharacterized protein n=1 Tax=Anguilla anguilla TaxID=7936 RepID=A0A0E9THP2_ANGAN
MLLVTYHQDN